MRTGIMVTWSVLFALAVSGPAIAADAGTTLLENERVKVVELVMPPGETRAAERHPEAVLIEVLSGQLRLNLAEGPRVVTTGQYTYLAPMASYTAINSSARRANKLHLVYLKASPVPPPAAAPAPPAK